MLVSDSSAAPSVRVPVWSVSAVGGTENNTKVKITTVRRYTTNTTHSHSLHVYISIQDVRDCNRQNKRYPSPVVNIKTLSDNKSTSGLDSFLL